MKRILLTNKWLLAGLHILIWGVVFALPYLTYSGQMHHRPVITSAEESGFFKLNLIGYFFWIGVFYLNGYYLIINFFNKRKYLEYILLLLITFAVVMVGHGLLFKMIIIGIPFNFFHSVMFNLPAFLLAITVSFAYRMALDKVNSDKLQLQKEKENMKTELSFLRSQISPHFILNVLNNIVALNRLKSDDLEPTLMKLSGLMQYMLYETDEEKVSIRTEADYIQSYIELQQQRFGSKVKISFSKNIVRDYVEIEPMLIIPFVENAFKHGIGLITDPFIDIQLTTNEHDELFLNVRNKFRPYSKEVKDKTSGIGLSNVEKRLKILYGDKYSLQISNKNEIFDVMLYINLAD